MDLKVAMDCTYTVVMILDPASAEREGELHKPNFALYLYGHRYPLVVCIVFLQVVTIQTSKRFPMCRIDEPTLSYR